MFAVLRLSRRFCVTLGRAQLFWQTVGACDHVTFELGFSHIGGVKTLKRISENLANVRGKNDILQLSFEFFGSNSRYVQVDESKYEPLLVKEVLSLLLLWQKSVTCQDFSMSNVHFL